MSGAESMCNAAMVANYKVFEKAWINAEISDRSIYLFIYKQKIFYSIKTQYLFFMFT